jgi:hypothetical protein
MGIFDRSSSTQNTNLYDQTTTTTTQTDQSGNSGLNLSDVAGVIGISLHNEVSDAGAIDAGRELGVRALSTVERVNADSLELLAGLANNTIDASKTLARDSAESHSSFLQDAIAGFGSLAKQNTQSADDRLTKIVGIALAAVAAVVVLPALFKSGGKAVTV